MPLSFILYFNSMVREQFSEQSHSEENTLISKAQIRSRKRILLFRLSSVCIGLGGLFLLLEIILRFLPVRESPLAQPVTAGGPVMRFEPNREHIFSRDWNFTIVTHKKTNGAGFFSDIEYVRDSKKPLVAIIGDSYVEALHVRNSESVHGRIGQDNFEKVRVYAFGASGNPLSSYLKYAEWVRERYNPEYFIFVIVGNDFDESFARYKGAAPGFTYFPDNKDLFDMGSLETRYWAGYSFLGRSFRRSYLAKYLVSNCEVLRITGKADTSIGEIDKERIQAGKNAIQHFIRLIPEATKLPPERILLVLDASRHRVYSQGADMGNQTYYERVKPELLRKAQEAKIMTLDTMDSFARHYEHNQKKFEYPTDGHWNEIGHRVVAESIMNTDFWSTVIGE